MAWEEDYDTILTRHLNGIERLMRKQGRQHVSKGYWGQKGLTSITVILSGDLAREFEPIWDEFMGKKRAEAQP